jgi:hypothetical protein
MLVSTTPDLFFEASTTRGGGADPASDDVYSHQSSLEHQTC